MRKNFLALALFSIVLLNLCGCNKKNQEVIDLGIEQREPNFIDTEVKNVSVDIYNISITGATITIKDTNNVPYVYGEWYELQKQEDSEWVKVEPITNEYGFNDMGNKVDENNEITFIIDWTKIYGRIPLGSYRIVKKVQNQYITIPFNLAETSEILLTDKNESTDDMQRYNEIK